MKNTLKRFFLRSPSNYIFWILLALLVKGVIPFLQLLLAHRSDPHLLSLGFIGDGPSYTDPIENLIKTGHYSPDRRMPGYGIIYLIFRALFSYDFAYNSIIVIQLIANSLSVYCLALLSHLIIKSNLAFYLTFYLFLISTYSNYYDICIGTESLCSAFLIFGTWYFALYFEKTKLNFLFCSGLFLTWATFLRPVFVIILFIYSTVLLIYVIRSKKHFIKPILIFGLTFILADGAWVARNYSMHDEFIPLARGGFYYPYVEYSYMSHELEFIQSWGGAVQLPDEHSALSWFGGILFPGETEVKQYDSIPDNIYTSKFNKDSLYLLKKEVKKFISIQKPTVDSFYNSTHRDWTKAFAILYEPLKPVSPQAAKLQNIIDDKFDKYRTSIEKEKPFLYYTKAPMVLLRKFLFENNTDYFKRFQFPGIAKFMTSFYHLFYLAVLFLGIVGIILLTWKGIKGSSVLLLLPIIPAYTIIIHPLLRAAYNRFLLPVWPFILACAVYTIILILNKIEKVKD